MPKPSHHDYLAFLQPLAAATIRRGNQESGTAYWRRICKDAGLPEKPDMEDLTWNELYQVHEFLVEKASQTCLKWGNLIDQMQKKVDEAFL